MSRRENMYAQPWRKHMQSFQSFVGGLNTVTSNDNLDDRELTDLSNIDLGDRGSLKRRNGFIPLVSPATQGKGQGYFRLHKADGTFEHILAVNGKLYNSLGEIVITGLASFQTERTIEAVQMGEKLIIATGTNLVEYNGTEAKVVVPYTPKPLEYLYIGQNGLADNPDSHIQDGTFTELRLDGVYPNKKYGVANEDTEFKVIVSKPDGMIVEYKYEYRKKGDTSWILGSDWGTSNLKYFKSGSVETYELRFLVREQGSTTPPPEFIMPAFKVKETAEPVEVDDATIKTCNRILLHWDRIILYGDTGNPQAIYISDLNKHDYFPRANSLEFLNKRNEKLTDIVRFRDMLVAFTPTSIQAVFGKHPREYARLTLNSEIGCNVPYTAKVMENYVTFLAKDGIYVLKSVGTSETRANVEKIDTKIQNIIPKTTKAYAIVEDYQYQIIFPDEKKRFRYYYQLGSWTKDESERFNFSVLHPDKIVQDGVTGVVYQFNKDTWTDDGFIYKDVIETKYFDFNETYSRKKLKEIQILMKHHSVVVNTNVYIYADSALVLDPDESYASVDAQGNIVWNIVSNPNLVAKTGTTLGAWEMGTSSFGEVDSEVHELKIAGKCRRTKMVMMHEQATPNQLLGLGIIFKLKSP